MSDYVQAFFTIPYRIMQLPDLTIQLLKFYETVFHFWHTGNQCFLKNDALKDRAHMKSDSTVANAFQYFEKHGEMKRVMKGNRRYIVQPVRALETDSVDNSAENSSNSNQGLAAAREGSRSSEGEGLAAARHNNNNINNINLKKSSCDKSEEKKHKAVDKIEDWKESNHKKQSWAAKKEAPTADVTKQSTSYDPDKYRNTERIDSESRGYKEFLNSVPTLKRKHKKRKEDIQTTKLPAGTSVSTQVPSREHSGEESSEHALDGKSYFSSELRDSNRVLATSSARSYLEKARLASKYPISST